jgi:hypothetical protein
MLITVSIKSKRSILFQQNIACHLMVTSKTITTMAKMMKKTAKKAAKKSAKKVAKKTGPKDRSYVNSNQRYEKAYAPKRKTAAKKFGAKKKAKS